MPDRVATALRDAVVVALEVREALADIVSAGVAVLVLELLTEALGDRVAVVVLEAVVLEDAVFVTSPVADPFAEAEGVLDGWAVAVVRTLENGLRDGNGVFVTRAV